MKKNLSLSLVALMGLSMISTSTHAIMTPTRCGQCAFKPTQYKCSPQERSYARNWLITAGTTALLAVAALVGIGTVQAMKARKDAQTNSNPTREFSDTETNIPKTGSHVPSPTLEQRAGMFLITIGITTKATQNNLISAAKSRNRIEFKENIQNLAEIMPETAKKAKEVWNLFNPNDPMN